MGVAEQSAGVYSVSMAVLLIWRDEGVPATVRAVAKRVGLIPVSTAHKWLERAWRAGLIDKRGSHYVPLDDCVCPNCGASHVSERQSA